MDSNSKAKLEEVKTDVATILGDLRSTKDVFDNNFHILSNKDVNKSINSEIAKYERLQKKLNHLNTDSYTPEYLQSHPELMQDERDRRLHNDQRCY